MSARCVSAWGKLPRCCAWGRKRCRDPRELVGRDPKLSLTDVVGAGKRGVIGGG